MNQEVLISACRGYYTGIAANIDKYEKQSADYVEEKIKAIWNNPEFTNCRAA